MDQVPSKSANALAEERTELAVFRTMLAASRSLMAWVRTGLAMIGFGFTTYKFIEGMGPQVPPNAGRNAGLFLIALGTVSVLFGCIEYWQNGRELRRTMRLFPLVFAGVISALGVVLFLAVWLGRT